MSDRSDQHVRGVLVVDKPQGVTSHDIVQRARKKLRQRRIGHAGTLDPMATGVLVIMVGEATKLGPYLTANDKSYRATVMFGSGTDTLDADGQIVAEGELPASWPAGLEAALEEERARTSQRPPIYSAIKVGGKSAHARVRAGEDVELAPRDVAVRSLELRGIDGPRVDLEMCVAKGYYVRSLARDLGERMDVPAHLCALRRTASGVFTLDDATKLEAPALLSLRDAATRALSGARLTAEGVTKAGHGGPMKRDHFSALPPASDAPSVWLGPDDEVVAIGTTGDPPKVLRGFST